MPAKLFAGGGLIIAVSAVLMGSSIIQAASFNAGDRPGLRTDTTGGQPVPQEPLEERIKRALEDLDREAQTALAQVGVLDTPEQVARAEDVLRRLEQTTREVEKRAHNRASERLDELNHLAVARLQVEAQSLLRALGRAEGPEQRRQAQEVRARTERLNAQIEEQVKQERDRLTHIHDQRGLPSLDVRATSVQHPASVLPAPQGRLSESEVADQVRQLGVEARAALDRLGPLDTPGKVEMAARIRATLANRIKVLREQVAGQVEDNADRQLEEQVRRLRQRATGAIEALGELDTPEKERYAATLRERTEEQVRQLVQRAQNRPDQVVHRGFEEEAKALRRRAQTALEALGELDTLAQQESARQIETHLEQRLAEARQRWNERSRLALESELEQEAPALRRRAQMALEALGELDTPEKQELARRIQVQLEQKIQDLRHQLARRAHAAAPQSSAQEAVELRRRAQEALAQLGRLDTPEKVRQARAIRARLEHDLNLQPTLQVERPDPATTTGARGRDAEVRAQAQAQEVREREAQQQEESRRREAELEEARRREAQEQQVRPLPTPTRETGRTPVPTREPESTREPSRDSSTAGGSSAADGDTRDPAVRP